MNTNPVPPQLPTAAAVPLTPGAVGPAPGQDPLEREPILNAVVAIEALLRQPRRVLYQLRQPGSSRLVGSMLFVALVCSLVYGVVVGSFSMGTQLWAAPLKIAGGLLVCAVICLPSLYIFTCLSGSRASLGEICGLLAGLVMLMTLLLLGFAPVAWLFSQSTNSLVWMGALHLLFWLIATVFGLRFLQAGFSHSQPRSAAGLNTWTLIFILVMLQMTTALRPLVGKSPTFFPVEKKFFVTHWGDCLKAEQPASRRTAAD
jgi:hypothetical protein